jgi:hypothetical protein
LKERKLVPPWTTTALLLLATVRMMLLLGLFCGLKTTQVDYTNALTQADLPEPEYLELPQYFKMSPESGFK